MHPGSNEDEHRTAQERYPPCSLTRSLSLSTDTARSWASATKQSSAWRWQSVGGHTRGDIVVGVDGYVVHELCLVDCFENG